MTNTSIVETAGAFWLAAEALILYGLLILHKRLHLSPFPNNLRLTRKERKTGLALGVSFLAAVTLLLLRAQLFPDYFETSKIPGEPNQSGPGTELFEQSVHLAIWSTFITLWVVLEMAIVAVGIASYKQMRRSLAK